MFALIVDPAMDDFGSQGVRPARDQVHGSTVGMFLWHRKEELMHTTVENRGQGTSRRESPVRLSGEDIPKGVSHQSDWQFSTTGEPVVPKPQAITKCVRPIIVVRLLLHLVVECGKRGAGIAALIPRVDKGADGAGRVAISVVSPLQQVDQTANVQATALQRSCEGFDTDQRLVFGQPFQPNIPIDLKKRIGHAQTWNIAVPVQMQLVGLGPVHPINRAASLHQFGKEGIEPVPALDARPFVKTTIVSYCGDDRVERTAVTP